MDAPLTGRVALVTGVSRRGGIGFTIARRLLADGASVFVHSWAPHDAEHPWGADPDGVDALVVDLGPSDRVAHRELDFLDPDAPAVAVQAAVERFGALDIVVANHARSSYQSLEDLTAAELDAAWAVNARASLLLVQAYAAQHDGREGGRVVLMTSGQHLGPMSSEIAYAVSKGALHQATATLSDGLIDRGITVNAVNPGPTDTGWAIHGWDPHPAMPLGRWGTPDDAAGLIGFLCTDDGGWITGQVIDSEGGFRR
jgi:3-oxoacyl-[acyl-carrier protein] reductase